MDKLKFDNPFCPLPFIHQHIDTKKRSKVCCYADDNGFVSDSMDFNSDDYKLVRDNISQGKWSDACVSCRFKEMDLVISPRQIAVRDLYKKHKRLIDSQIELHKQGENLRPYTYDLRISNLCNLTCQTCDAVHSSSIAKELGEETVFLSYEPSMDINPNAIRIYFAGGEPFLIKKYADVLDRIDNKDCEVIVNTNGTMVTDRFLAALKQFKTVNITLSLDGFGELNSMIRKGSNWDQIVKNIQIFKDQGFSLHVNTVVQKDNINELLELGQFLEETNIEKWSWCELEEPTEFVWTHTKLDTDKMKRVLELKIVKTNVELTTLINKLLK